MGVETALLTAAAVSIGSSIYGGISAKKSAGQEAGLLEEEGLLLQQEATEEADRRAKQVRAFAAQQKLAFIKNGVQLDGSPLGVIDETLTEGQKEVDSVVRRGNALKSLRFKQAEITRRGGRAALVGGFGSAASSLLTYGAVKSGVKK